MFELPSSPLAVGGVVDSGIRLFRASFARSWPLAVIQSVAGGASGIYQALKLQSLGAAGPFALYQSPMFWLVTLAGGLVSTLVYCALTSHIAALAQGQSGRTLRESLAIGARKLPSVVGATLLFALAVAVGFLLLIIPGVYLSVALLLYLPIMVLEGKGPVEALKESRRFVRGNFWRSSAVLTVVFIFLIIVGVAVTGGVGFAATQLFNDQVIAFLVVQIVSVAVNIFLSPLLVAAFIVLYFDLKLRKEGGDLEARLAEAS